MSSPLPRGIRDNMQFMVAEVDSQLAALQLYFQETSKANGMRILDRSGYSDNLKIRIHTSCLNLIACQKTGAAQDDQQLLRSIENIATHLERITELGRDCIKQVDLVNDRKCLQAQAYPSMLEHIRNGVAEVIPALENHDSQHAHRIESQSNKLHEECDRLYQEYFSTLKTRRKKTRDIAHALFVAHSVEQMGEALIEISESILSANIGQPINLQQYRTLNASINKLGMDSDLKGLQVSTIAHTRSGSSISGVSKNGHKDEPVGVYKDGLKRKLKEERQGVESWHEIYPGLAPKILAYKKRGQSASLLIEHLPGLTVEQILLNESDALLQQTLRRMMKTLKAVWRQTRTDKPINAEFMRQLSSRLGAVYKIHPEFRYSDQQICGVDVSSFDELVGQAAKMEQKLAAPFSVYIHGDFNLDNIIYDPLEKRINFIDLHRSCYMDYVQDVSVFMVSNYRLQILDAPVRRRMMSLAIDFYERSRRFADKSGDNSFELRLALGLARSFASSTRFILDKSLARSMFLRARYLLEYSLQHGTKRKQDFELPIKEIFIG